MSKTEVKDGKNWKDNSLHPLFGLGVASSILLISFGGLIFIRRRKGRKCRSSDTTKEHK